MAPRSWIASANAPDHDFPVLSLPYSAFRRPREALRRGVAIGDFVRDLSVLEQTGLLGVAAAVFGRPNIIVSAPERPEWSRP